MPTIIEIKLELNLGSHAPGDLQAAARSLALSVAPPLKAEAQSLATTAAEASGSEEVHAALPRVFYRVGSVEIGGRTQWGEWLDVADSVGDHPM